MSLFINKIPTNRYSSVKLSFQNKYSYYALNIKIVLYILKL